MGIQNDGNIPTRLINLLVDLNVESTTTNRTCYICNIVCNCNILMKLRNSKKKPTLLTYVSEPNLPDIDLIDDFNADLILKCAKNDNDMTNDLDLSNQGDIKKDVSYLDVDNKNSSRNNFELEFDFDSPIDLTSPENKKENLDDNLDTNFDIGDIEDIFADSSPDEAIAKEVEVKNKNSSDPKEALGFFGLDSIDDIFADSDESVDKVKTPAKQVIKDRNSLDVDKPKTPETNFTKGNNTQKSIVKPIPVFQTSPSILSGKPATTTSPILCSQVRKFKLSTKKLPQSSTPTSNVKRRLIPELTNNNTILADEKGNTKSSLLQNKTADTSDKSMFTITQLVDIINKTDRESSIVTKSIISNNASQNKDDERSTSPILLTQAERKKVTKSSTYHSRSNIAISKPKKSESLIILESDSDSEHGSDNTQIYELNEKANELNAKELVNNDQSQYISKSFSINEGNRSQMNPKRKFESDDEEEMIASPFFNKRPKIDTESNKQHTLKEKVLAALTSNKMNTNFNNDANIHFVLSPQKILSQKENQNPKISDLDNRIEDKKEQYVRKNNLEMLQIFRRDSKFNSPSQKFESLFSQKAENSQKRILAFSDSDDDFFEENNSNYRSQRPAKLNKNNSITNHKVRKVSNIQNF